MECPKTKTALLAVVGSVQMVVFPVLLDGLPYSKLLPEPQVEANQVLPTHQLSHVVIRQVLAFKLRAEADRKVNVCVNQDK